jgi:hypothetical protein
VNFRDTLKVRRINVMRVRYVTALRRLCTCPVCTARRAGGDPLAAVLQLIGDSVEAAVEIPVAAGGKTH